MHIQSRANLLEEPVYQVIVALGSNHDAEANLERARNALEALSSTFMWSTPFENADYTATLNQPKPNYINQCGLLTLKEGRLTLKQMIEFTKSIETSISKLNSFEQSVHYRQVAIDIDVLMMTNNQSKSTKKKNSNESHFIAILERTPFKHHEQVGLIELGIII